jgi:tetratricopeptide (TPR) repeat protein
VVLLSVVGYVAYQKKMSQPQKRQGQAVNFANKGREFMRQGESEKAYLAFKQAHALNPNDSSIYLYLGVLLPTFENDTLKAKRLLQELESRSEGGYQVKTALGLNLLLEGDEAGAERYFKEALALQPGYSPALTNLGQIYLSKNQLQVAQGHIQKALSQDPKDGLSVLAFSEWAFQMWRNSGDRTVLQRARKEIKQYLLASQDYQQELMIVDLGLKEMMSEGAKATGGLNSADPLVAVLDLDPKQSSFYSHNLFTFREGLEKRVFQHWCPEVIRKRDSSALTLALRGVCRARLGQVERARAFLEDALKRNPQHPLLHAVYAYVLGEQGMDLEQGTSIGNALKFDRSREYSLPLIYQAQFDAQSGLWDGAVKNWQELLKRRSDSLPALAGLAQAYKELGDVEQARVYLKRGMVLTQSYRPLLKINEEIKDL